MARFSFITWRDGKHCHPTLETSSPQTAPDWPLPGSGFPRCRWEQSHIQLLTQWRQQSAQSTPSTWSTACKRHKDNWKAKQATNWGIKVTDLCSSRSSIWARISLFMRSRRYSRLSRSPIMPLPSSRRSELSMTASMMLPPIRRMPSKEKSVSSSPIWGCASASLEGTTHPDSSSCLEAGMRGLKEGPKGWILVRVSNSWNYITTFAYTSYVSPHALKDTWKTTRRVNTGWETSWN